MKDRLVFENTIVDPKLFQVEKEGPMMCRIEAGEVQGIAVGTVFELYEMDENLKKDKILGTAVASQLFSTYCQANIAEGVNLEGGRYTASVLQPAYKLKFSIVNKAPGSAKTIAIQALTETSLDRATSKTKEVLCRMDPGEEGVELELEIEEDGGGITLRRKDIFLRDLVTRSPRITAEEVEEPPLDVAPVSVHLLVDVLRRFPPLLLQGRLVLEELFLTHSF